MVEENMGLCMNQMDFDFFPKGEDPNNLEITEVDMKTSSFWKDFSHQLEENPKIFETT